MSLARLIDVKRVLTVLLSSVRVTLMPKTRLSCVTTFGASSNALSSSLRTSRRSRRASGVESAPVLSDAFIFASAALWRSDISAAASDGMKEPSFMMP